MQGQGGGLISFLPLIIMIAIFYFGLIRPQKKREKKISDMRESLSIGDEILTIGGIRGKVIQVKPDIVTIETSGLNTRLELQKWGIQAVENKRNVSASSKESTKKSDDVKEEDKKEAKKEDNKEDNKEETKE